MAWSKVSNIKGPQGAKGATGSQGPQGAQGPQGPSGVTTASKPLNYNAGTKALTMDAASQTAPGYMSAADKKKLDGMGEDVDVPNSDFIAFITAE